MDEDATGAGLFRVRLLRTAGPGGSMEYLQTDGSSRPSRRHAAVFLTYGEAEAVAGGLRRPGVAAWVEQAVEGPASPPPCDPPNYLEMKALLDEFQAYLEKLHSYLMTGQCPNSGDPSRHPCGFCDRPEWREVRRAVERGLSGQGGVGGGVA